MQSIPALLARRRLMPFLLDTDTCIWVLREREPVLKRIQRESPDHLAIASMTEAELRYGALRSSDPEGAMQRVEAWLSAPLQVLPFGRKAAREHARLRHQLRAQPIGERDLVIASVAVAAGRILVTGNTREFQRIGELGLADWLRS